MFLNSYLIWFIKKYKYFLSDNTGTISTPLKVLLSTLNITINNDLRFHFHHGKHNITLLDGATFYKFKRVVNKKVKKI